MRVSANSSLWKIHDGKIANRMYFTGEKLIGRLFVHLRNRIRMHLVRVRRTETQLDVWGNPPFGQMVYDTRKNVRNFRIRSTGVKEP